MKTLTPGQWLHASCSDEWFEILAVGVDDNDMPTIDISVPDINEFIDCRWDTDDNGDQRFMNEGPPPSLMRVEPAAVIFRGLQWRPVKQYDDMIECNTPGRGCYRCTELFTVRDKKRT